MAKYTLHFTAIISEELVATDELQAFMRRRVAPPSPPALMFFTFDNTGKDRRAMQELYEIVDTLNEPQPPEACDCGTLLIDGVCQNCGGDA